MDDSPMSLQTLAAKSVCIRLVYEWAEDEMPIINVWRRGYQDGAKENCPAHHWFMWQLGEMQIPRFANIPIEVQYQIEDNMPPILEEVKKWILHHHLLKFFHDEPSSSLSEYIVKLVWNHRFKVDNLATAKNIQTNDNLTPLERFMFASTYCIVDEIEKFRDTMDLVSEWLSIGQIFVGYWSRYLTNKLDTIDVPKNSSIELWYLKSAGELDLWSSAEYFFDKLDPARKSAQFERVLEMYEEHNMKNLLAKLAVDKEWNLACRAKISKIVENIVQYGTVDQVQFVWKLFQSETNSKNFAGILETLVLSSMRNARDFEKWTPVLMEIWSSASSKLKQSAIDDVKLWQSIGKKCMSIIAHGKTSDFRARRLQISDPMKFIRLVLNSIPAKQRTTFFERNFCWLIIWAPFAAVDELMRDFLECYNRDVVKLKKVVANCSKIERPRGILIAFGEFDELDAVVSFYFPGVDGISANDGVTMQNKLRSHKLQFLMSDSAFDAICFCVYCGDWKPLYEYVQKNVSWLAPIATEAIMRKVILQGRYWTRKIDNGEMTDLKEFVSMVYLNTQPDFRASAGAQLKDLKKRFERRMWDAVFDDDLRKKIIFDRARTQDFLLWVYNGNKRLIVQNFKQPSLFADGFLVQLKGCVAKGSFQVTKSMEEFLEWCFATEAERQRFKRKMIYAYRKHKMIEGLLMRRQYRRRMLLWFFDQDTSLIEKFIVDCARNPMCPYPVPKCSGSDDSSDDSDDDEDLRLDNLRLK